MDPPKFTAINLRFHKILYTRCPNRHLLNMVEKEWALLATTRKSAFAFIPERASGSVAEHEQLLRLIEASRSAEEIEAFARRHRMKTARSLLQHIGNEMSDDIDVVAPAP
jgi:DNA-binding GntR family transcriptional regulator